MVCQRSLHTVYKAVELYDSSSGSCPVTKLVIIVKQLVSGEDKVLPLPVVSVDHPLGGEPPEVSPAGGAGQLGHGGNVL